MRRQRSRAGRVLRRHFGGVLRAVIAETVADPSDVEDELNHLIRALAT